MKPAKPRCGSWAGLVILFATATASAALAAPLAFPGGQIDADRLAQGEIYLGVPKPAAAPKGCDIARRYAAYVTAGEIDKVVGLYAPDAYIFHDNGAPVHGREEIAHFYGRQINNFRARVVPVSFAVGPGTCLVQLAVSLVSGDGGPGYFSATYDQFILGADGKAKMMLVYWRKPPVLPEIVNDPARAKP